jgi:hypothetical protein
MLLGQQGFVDVVALLAPSIKVGLNGLPVGCSYRCRVNGAIDSYKRIAALADSNNTILGARANPYLAIAANGRRAPRRKRNTNTTPFGAAGIGEKGWLEWRKWDRIDRVDKGVNDKPDCTPYTAPKEAGLVERPIITKCHRTTRHKISVCPRERAVNFAVGPEHGVSDGRFVRHPQEARRIKGKCIGSSKLAGPATGTSNRVDVGTFEIEYSHGHGLPIEYVHERIGTEHNIHDAAENVFLRTVYGTKTCNEFKSPRLISPEANASVVHRNRTPSQRVDLDA